ncbi:MAG: DUF885 domain-containing protein [Actinomycetota bacterium]
MSDTRTDIFAVSDRAVDRLAEANPLLATEMGVGGHDDRWPDLSPDGLGEMRRTLADIRRDADACDATDRRHALAKRVLVDYCDGYLALHESGHHLQDLNNIVSPHQELRFTFGSMAADTVEDWELVLRRLETIDEPLNGYRQSLDEGRLTGLVASRRQVEAVIDQGRLTIGDDSPFDELRTRLAAADLDAPELAARLDAAIDGAKRAFGDFDDYLTGTYLASAAEADAVGEDRYRLAAGIFLGTDLDLAATYRWGWDEVERLWSAIQDASARIDPDVEVSEVIRRLKFDPAYAASDVDEFVELMSDRQTRALEALDGVHFDVPAAIRSVAVQVEPAGGASAAHYVPPSEDFSRPGSVWYPVAGKTHFPLFQEITTAYHEGFPGHHLQMGVQLTQGDALSRFHKVAVWYPGSGEGWALYAEHLMGELGYLERPEYEIGLLSSQLLRACRVAFDIGAHLDLPIPDDVTFHPGERWTYELGVELLVERALTAVDDAESEVTRYLGWPGQAISYKVGEQAILDLRAEAEAAGGFEPKAFHARVLEIGSVGLDLLREHVRAA